MLLGKWKLKTAIRYNYKLLEGPKSGTQSPNASEDMEQHEHCDVACGNARLYSHFGRQLVVSYKTKHSLTVRSYDYAPWYLSKGCENLGPHKTYMWMFIAAFICNCQNLEETMMFSIGEWINKLWCI